MLLQSGPKVQQTVPLRMALGLGKALYQHACFKPGYKMNIIPLSIYLISISLSHRSS